MKKFSAAVSVFALLVAQLGVGVLPAQAAVSSWQKGASIVPASTTDFGSASFNQSLQNLKNTGANAVALVVPYYQSNIYSTDVAAGWNTPTDASLGSAIDYAHSLGLAVTLKIHDDPYTGDWRAHINPSDRTGWFTNYGSALLHVASIGQTHHAEMIVIGTEMVSMASSQIDGSNTQNWLDLIGKIRGAYSGKLTYDANSTNNNTDPFENEKATIGFWSALDYAGLSAYYNLNTGANDVASLQVQWDYWNQNDIKQFAQSVGKPVLFMEVGYRSVDNAHQQPWNWQNGGGYNPTEQANDYQALMTYWNNYPYLGGVYWWSWSSSPGAGGSGDTGYTPQNKPAEQVLTQWFTNPTSPTNSTPTFMTSASAPGGQVGAATPITVTVQNTGGALQNSIVDVEIYNAAGGRVSQQFFSGQNIASNQTITLTANLTAPAAGTYSIAVGVFNNNWSQTYSWNGTAGKVTITSAPSNPPPSGNSVTDVWWPANGAAVSGVQPFKALLENTALSQYQMYWQVGAGQLNPMADNTVGYPHKEVSVDLSGWKWSPNKQYTITFVSKDSSGNALSTKSVLITVNN